MHAPFIIYHASQTLVPIFHNAHNQPVSPLSRQPWFFTLPYNRNFLWWLYHDTARRTSVCYLVPSTRPADLHASYFVSPCPTSLPEPCGCSTFWPRPQRWQARCEPSFSFSHVQIRLDSGEVCSPINGVPARLTPKVHSDHRDRQVWLVAGIPRLVPSTSPSLRLPPVPERNKELRRLPSVPNTGIPHRCFGMSLRLVSGVRTSMTGGRLSLSDLL
ncbi:hypothetical protein FA13DRAFT_724505 [Coprinellus micaceus]|uniref:Uncharacterized protein n=1 Tax=Coprinellus micaceus TaxID=71717 RepID=A0A4Y7TVZ4_COPMI|nr:hypothetical protein FA13DRAFT_724505 [Coprinellus micaceus]